MIVETFTTRYRWYPSRLDGMALEDCREEGADSPAENENDEKVYRFSERLVDTEDSEIQA